MRFSVFCSAVCSCAIGLFAPQTPWARGQLAAADVVSLPAGVEPVWELERAHRLTTATRERVCINGLWCWQPARTDDAQVPLGDWGYFKVPGSWPGVTDYMQKDCQQVWSHASWRDQPLRDIQAAWYQRRVTVPGSWGDRRIVLQASYLNSFAEVFVDGRRIGSLRFPGGELELTEVCRPGAAHTLSLLVVAMPLNAVMMSYNDTASARQVAGSVARRGLCGDVYLAGTPRGARVEDIQVDTSVREWTLSLSAALSGLAADATYRMRAEISRAGERQEQFTSGEFRARDLVEGRFTWKQAWQPEQLWDIHTPENAYELQLTLLEADDTVCDVAHPVRFGFREFWIDGRDFYLNGTRIYLSSVPLDNAQVGAAWATYEAARESMRRLRRLGINFVYTHNYGCQPGSHLGFDEILRAADDEGLLVSFSQPHFGHYDWNAPDAAEHNGYAQHAAFYVQVARNHPAVVAYSTSHNATGYAEDMNPDMIDGLQAERSQWSTRNVERALIAESIIRGLDPSRIVYHHSSGNLGAMHTSNFYANFVPVQEMSDWFEHWATQGVKPLFTCEYSVPMPWDWTLYRGWYNGRREFGSARAPWEFCVAEWNAQFLGDTAYQISPEDRENLRWEARQFRARREWHRWDYPHQVGSTDLLERYPVYAQYFADNWPAFRTWGVSANSPWNHGHYWTLRKGVDKSRRACAVDWQNLQRPGFSPDFIDEQYERIDLAYDLSDWVPTVAAEALLRNNGPLLAYLAGPVESFTSKSRNHFVGEALQQQLIVINNSRVAVAAQCQWTLQLPHPVRGRATIEIPAGDQVRRPLDFATPADLPPGPYALHMEVSFSTGETQQDQLLLHFLPHPDAVSMAGRIGLFDPRGATRAWLDALPVRYEQLDAHADPARYDLVIVGSHALTPDGPAPDLAAVRRGLKVLLFEQTPEVLEQRFGFRVATYGLRQVFRRIPDHPILSGIDDVHLRDWRGAATIVPPRLDYTLDAKFNYVPTVRWCGLTVPRLWRCGNQGNVATALIEKPHRGDFLPILDGGFSLQYSPLLECREGDGVLLFCQLDVTGRTEQEPAAEVLSRNMLSYLQSWQPAPRRDVLLAGDPQTRQHLERLGLSPDAYAAEKLTARSLLIVTAAGEQQVARDAAAIGRWLETGGRVLGLGLSGAAAGSFLPVKVETNVGEHIAAYFPPPPARSPLAGICPADVHSPAPRSIPLLASPAGVGNGVLGLARTDQVVFCQLSPADYADDIDQHNVKRTYRRTSFLLSRLLANLGAAGHTPLVERFAGPVSLAVADVPAQPLSDPPQGRWLEGLYLDTPEEWDDPYRFFRW